MRSASLGRRKTGVEWTFIMAVERRESFAMPAFKRQRLEEETNFDHSDPAIDVFNPNNCISDNLKASKDVFDAVSSDPHNDDSGGDSGFHEIIPTVKGPISTDTYNNTPIIAVPETNSETISTNENAQKEHNSFKPNEETPSSESSTPRPRKLSRIKKCLDKGKSSPPSTSNVNSSDEEADDVASTISDISGLSDISDLSGHEWKPIAGPVTWVQRQINNGADPRNIIQELIPKGTVVPDHLDDITLWKIIVNILSEPPRRSKLSHINTLDDVMNLLKTSKNVIVLTGAGVSVSSGIPDFRSTNGIYARLSKDFPDLPDPQAMFDIHYFRKDPRPFFKFAKEIYPGQFQPSVSHHFIRLLEEKGKLLRNYSQNIDTLEKAAGITKSITCHGSFATASCTRCQFKVDCSVIQEDIFNQRIPLCPKCSQHDSSNIAVMKPDIVFFGEGLSDEFHSTMGQDKDVCDLLIVMGSSLKVRPVALIPSSIPSNIPQILINREPLKHLDFDVQLLGDCDVIIEEICRRLGPEWSRICQNSESLQELNQLPPRPNLINQSEVNNNLSSTMEESTSSSLKETNHLGSSETKEDGGSCDCSQFEKFHLDEATVANDEAQSATDLGIEDSAEIADLELAWQQKHFTIASQLPERSFLFLAPNRYIFPGAEVELDGEFALTKDPNNSMEVEPSSDYEEADTASESVHDRSADSLLGVSNVEIDCDNEINESNVNCNFEKAAVSSAADIIPSVASTSKITDYDTSGNISNMV